MFISNECVNQVFTIFRGLDFTDEQIILLLRRWNVLSETIDKVEKNFPIFEEYLQSLQYTKEQIRDFACLYPKAMTAVNQPVYYSKYRPNGFERIKETAKTSAREYHVDMEGILKILVGLGISKKRIEKLFKENVPIIFEEPERIKKNLIYLIGIGLSREEISACLEFNYKILEYDEAFYRRVEKVIAPYRIKLAEVLRMKMKRRANFQFEGVFALFEVANALSVDKEKFKKSLFSNPNTLNSSSMTIYDFSTNFKKLGFDEEQIKTIMETSVGVIVIDYETLKRKKDILTEYYDEEEAISMLVRFPGYFSMSCENIREKLDVGVYTNSLEFLFKNPKNLMQSAKLTLARFYSFCGDCSSRTLFLGEKEFIRHYNETNAEVIAKYEREKKQTHQIFIKN